MKIFAGALKGLKILTPKDSSTTRPTSAKVREAVLHKIQDEIQGSIFIDVFSGTGAVGLEAISRGAKGCYFIESNKSILKILKKNTALAYERMEKQGLTPNPYKIIPLDASKALSTIKNCGREEAYVIWADPPYSEALLWLKDLNRRNFKVLTQTKLVILELSSELLKHPQFEIKGWDKVFEKVYGTTAVVAWQRK